MLYEAWSKIRWHRVRHSEAGTSLRKRGSRSLIIMGICPSQSATTYPRCRKLCGPPFCIYCQLTVPRSTACVRAEQVHNAAKSGLKPTMNRHRRARMHYQLQFEKLWSQCLLVSATTHCWNDALIARNKMPVSVPTLSAVQEQSRIAPECDENCW